MILSLSYGKPKKMCLDAILRRESIHINININLPNSK